MLNWAKRSRIIKAKGAIITGKAKRPKVNTFVRPICRRIVVPLRGGGSNKSKSSSGSNKSKSSSSSAPYSGCYFMIWATIMDKKKLAKTNSDSDKKLTTSSNAKSKSSNSNTPKEKKTILSKFRKSLFFWKSCNSTKVNHMKSECCSVIDASSVPETFVTEEFQASNKRKSLRSSPQSPRINRRFDEGFCYAGVKKHKTAGNEIYAGILVIAVLSGILQGTLSAVLFAFSCCFFFRAMEDSGRIL